MDATNWRPTAPGGEPVMDTGDWRTQLQPDSRQRIVNKIMETLKRHLPFSGQEGLQELKKVAVRFEEKIYTAATNQSDYLRKISLKMLTMETKSQNTIPTGNGNKPLDPGASHSMPPQVHNPGQSLPISLSTNQSQARQQLSQNMQNSMSSNGVQSSAGLQSAMPSVSGLTQTIPNTVGQNANMQSISGVSQNPVGNSMGQGIPPNMFVNSQRQMPGRQQVVPPQQQQQSQNPQQYLYQQQIQQQLLKQKLQQGNHPHSLVQSHIHHQQQQQNLLQPNQLQSGLQTSTVMQPSMMQTVSGLQQNQPSSVQQSTQPMLQQHPQSVLRQQQQPQQSAGIHQQQTPMMQQPLLPPQQQLMGQQSNTTNMSQNQLIGQQNIVGDLQQQQLGQQNNLQNLQQQQLMAQQNNLSSMHQQQLGPQSNVTGLQQQQLLGAQPASLDSTAEIGHANGADWQEEIYQKIKVMKETYLPEINELYQRIATKLQQHDPLPQQPKSEQLEKLKVFKVMLERLITFLQVSKNNITPNFKEKLGFYEKQIVGFLNPSRYRKPIPNLQQGQPPQPRIQPMQQPQSQVPQLQSHENQLIPQLQSMNTQGSVPQMQQNNMSSLLHNSLSTLSGDSTSQSNMMNPIQPGSNLDSGQGNALSSLQQTPVGSVQKNLVSISQPTKVNTLSTQSGASMLQPNIPLQSNSNMIQHQHLKQQQQQHEQQMLQTQQLKRLQQHQNLMQNQQMQQQQLHQQAPSPMPGDSDKPVSGISSLLNTGNIVHQPSVAQAPAPSLAIGTPGISASPLLAEFTSPDGAHGGALTTVSGKSNVTEQPLERLIKAVKSLSPKALSASVGDIGSVVSMIDRIAGSAPGNGSRAAAGEDLVAMTKCRLQARNYITQDGMTGSRKMRRHTSAMPLNVVSSAGSVSDSFKQFTGPETSDLESTATSSVKRPRIEANHALLEEIREINQRLIDTVVDISDEDVDSTAVAATAEGGEGTIVKCSFSAVALSQNLKSQYASAQMSPIQPLRLLVPTNYPSCSPILLDRFPVEVSKEYEDLSIKAKSRFSISLRSLSQPMSLGEIARTWDVCARVVISEHAQQSGGGTFSSKYGSWENCLSAA